MASGVAGRVAEDLRRLHALVANARARQLLEALQAHALEREDCAFRLRSATAVIADLAVGAYHSMARDEVRDWIVGERGSNRTHGRRTADLARDPAVRADLAARNLPSLAEHGLLKRGQAPQIEAHPAPALQLVIDFGGQVGRRDRLDQLPADIL